jgi:hypothetical protein
MDCVVAEPVIGRAFARPVGSRNDEQAGNEPSVSGHAAPGLQQFCNLGQHADDRLAGERGLAVARAGLDRRRHDRTAARLIAGDGSPDQDRGLSKAVELDRDGRGLRGSGNQGRPVSLGGAVDGRLGGGGGNLLAADQIMAEGELHGARHQANGERSENSPANL